MAAGSLAWLLLTKGALAVLEFVEVVIGLLTMAVVIAGFQKK
jgi:hypothetical protein